MISIKLEYFNDDFILTCLHTAPTPDAKPGGIVLEIFQPQDLHILNIFLRQLELSDNTLDPGGPDDCVWDGRGWLDTKNLARLKREHDIRPTRIIVQAGDTVVIPARSPCQVRHPVLIDRFQSTDDRLIDALLVRLD